MAQFTNNAGVTLSYQGATKIATTATGVNVTGNATFADNGKAIFGAGSDLQIYHDGSNSYIREQGTGDLFIQGGANIIFEKTGGEDMLTLANDGSVVVKYNGVDRIETTSAGIDVTGTVTSDGLRADGVVEISSATPTLRFFETDQTDEGTLLRSAGDSFQITKMLDTGAADGIRFAVDQSSGDISFYEDTGVDAKFFWDANAESLGIRTDSPTTALDVRGGVNGSHATFTGQVNRGLVVSTANTLSNDDGVIYNAQTASSGKHIFQTAGTERMRIDSSGLTVDDGGKIQLTKNTTTSGDSLGIIEFHDEDGSATADAGKFQLQAFRGGDKDAPDFKLIGSDSTGVLRDRLLVEDNGDISFYEDTGTTAKFFWDASSESLGIGTTTPTRMLEVYNTGSSMLAQFKSASGDDAFICFANNTSTADGVRVGSKGNDLVLSTYFTPRVTVKYAGNVGIGTSSPEGTLQVENASNNALILNAPANRYNSVGFQTAGTDKWWLGRADSDQIASDAFFIGTDAGNATDPGGLNAKLVIAQSGNVGIGTSSPSVNLHVSSSGDTVARITSADGNGAFLDLGDASDPDGGRIVYDSGSNLAFSTASNERMRIDSSGNVGIGTSSPDAILDIEGNFETNYALKFTNTQGTGKVGGFRSHGTNGNDLTIYQDGVRKQGWSSSEVKFYGTSNAEVMRIQNDGNVGIGTSSPA